MARIALLTLAEVLDYVIDDSIAMEELARRGHEVEQVPWTDESVDWSQFDLVIVRSTWDYHHQPERFLQRIEAISAQAPAFENPVATIRWNLDKAYLRELEEKGVRIVPSVWGRGGTPDEFSAVARHFDSAEVIFKPTVSANAMDTLRRPTALSAAQAAELATIFADRHWFVQPFLESILTEGEYSVFYFGGRYSHAIRKVPRSGDFRVQEEHGGVIEGIELSDDVRAAAEAVMSQVSAEILQVRVDLVRLPDSSLALMELELIEPSLYFRCDAAASNNFADAVEVKLARDPARISRK